MIQEGEHSNIPYEILLNATQNTKHFVIPDELHNTERIYDDLFWHTFY